MTIKFSMPSVPASASAEAKASRMAICQACPSLRKKPVLICGECGCVLAAKTRFQRATCPIGKW
jgi:hypothetical protein